MLDIPTFVFFHFLLACLYTFKILISSVLAAQALDMSPAHTLKEVLLVANRHVATADWRFYTQQLCDELESRTCMFVISITTAKLPVWLHHVHAIMQ